MDFDLLDLRSTVLEPLDVSSHFFTVGTKVDDRDALGRTPLIIAALCNSVECAKILLKNGAWVSHKCAGGKTALHIAAQYPY